MSRAQTPLECWEQIGRSLIASAQLFHEFTIDDEMPLHASAAFCAGFVLGRLCRLEATLKELREARPELRDYIDKALHP